MRFIRILLFTFINLILFVLLKPYYEIIYHYYFGSLVFIPQVPNIFIYGFLFIIQLIFQILLVYELIFKKFITKKLNFVMFIPLLIVLLNINRNPYDEFKDYELPNFKIQELMFKIQTELEEYRVRYKYYPKTKERFFEKIVKNIDKKYFMTKYTVKTKRKKVEIIYEFDKNNPYLKNTKNYQAPKVIVRIDSSGKHYFITAVIKNGFIDGNSVVLSYNAKAFVLKDDVMIREKLRNKEDKDMIFNYLIRELSR